MNSDKKAELDYAWWGKFWELLIDRLILGAILGTALWIGNGILATYNAVLTKNVDDHKKVLTDGSNVYLADFQAKLTKELDKNRDELNQVSGKNLATFQSQLTKDLDKNRDELGQASSKNLEAFKNQMTQSLEEYRHRLAMQQYVAQKRFEAIDGVITAYNKLFELFVENTREKESTKKMREEYRQAIKAVFAAHNNKELVMPRKFSTQIEKLGFMHRGLLVNGFSDKKYMNLFVDLGDHLTQMGIDAIDPADKARQAKYFELAELPSAEDRKSNEVAGKYLDAELKRWEEWRKITKP